jgi:hypothetical protein
MYAFLGYCSDGYYTNPVRTTSCSPTPSGYYKPRVSFSDNYYACSANYISAGGATSCTACPSSSTTTPAGSDFCITTTWPPTGQPSGQPSHRPTIQPTGQPSGKPSSQPSRQPTGQPSSRPSGQPSGQPSVQPSSQPTGRPSGHPTAQPSSRPTGQPSGQPSGLPSGQPLSQPTGRPSGRPSRQPTECPTSQPTSKPSGQPSSRPTTQPTGQPSSHPSGQPSSQPTLCPTRQPTSKPSRQPTGQPSSQPSSRPTKEPTAQPSVQPSAVPSKGPSSQPTCVPTGQPTSQPSKVPSVRPTIRPSSQPTAQPSSRPAATPSSVPTSDPSSQPSGHPSIKPSAQPSVMPSSQPTAHPSVRPSVPPSAQPSVSPSTIPTSRPSKAPSSRPSGQPSVMPTRQPTGHPSVYPSSRPSGQPSGHPSVEPTGQPTGQPSMQPSGRPTGQPTKSPSSKPSSQPSTFPSSQPTGSPTGKPTMSPSRQPSGQPTGLPSRQPTVQPTPPPSSRPSSQPAGRPSGKPTAQPTERPSGQPTVLPSAKPCGQPSQSPSSGPTSQPSARPSRSPSSRPTGQPSGKPSVQPSRRPTSYPSSRPSTQPSSQPSAGATGAPTGSPSAVPSGQPSRQPTGQPSGQPSSQPVGFPTSRPSSQPSRAPSALPSRQPTSRPSVRPTMRPSVQPSSRPSSRPTREPSGWPTSRPTRQPTSRPTQQPVSRPSSRPSSQPSARPSLQPQSRPTAKPTGQPSRQPTRQPVSGPTSQPTRQPTSQPSKQPTGVPTGQPSGQPSSSPVATGVTKTDRPTAAPTAVPSYSLIELWTMRLTALKSTYASLMTSTSVVYADAFVDGSSVAGSSSSCTSWNSFYSSFELASISRQLLNLTFVSTKALSGNATVTSCSNSDSLTSLQEFATSGLSSTSVTCNSAKWSMQTCSNKFVFCANCSASLVDAVNVLSPCSSIVNSTCIGSTLQSASSSFARLLIATFVVETAPTIVSVQTYSQKQIITAYVTVNKAGAVFCGAWTSNRVPTSVQEIMQANNVGRATTGSNKAVNISMSALTPSTQYYVYCSTMSAHGTLSTLAQAMSSKVIVKTLCCKIITVNLLRRSVYAGSSLSALGTIAFTSGISDSLTLFVSSNSTSSTAPFFPQSLALTSTTSGARTIAFTGTATVGTVALSVSVSAAASSDYSIVYSNGNTVTVLSSQSKVPAPALLSAQFSNDGATVYLTFSGATNRGSTASNAVYFTCANMFNFRGVSSAQCQWSTDSTAVTIYPSPAYPLSIGSAVFMYASKVKSSCLATNATSCGAWPSNANANVTISAPGSAVKPSVLLALPSSIGSCDSLRIDIGGSSGSGGRAWSSTNFTVSSTASNVSLVAAYLKSNYKFGSPITVPRTLLQKGYLYTVSVTVCNFLGACGQATASVSVMNLAVPFAGIVGGPTFTATVNSSLQLSSTAYVASCDGSKSTLDLQYVWAVANGTSGASLSLTSKSRDPSKFILASYQLEPLVTYTFTLTVTSLSSLKSGSASVSVIVVQSDLIVVIAGGSERSVRALTSFSADASSSYDSDQANRGGVSLTYEWECWTISPEYLSDCLFTFSATNTSILASTAPSSSENSTSVLNLVIALSSRTANGQVFISVLSEQAPIVTVTSSQSGKVIVSNKLVLQGLVSTESDCNALWSISDPSIDLAAVSLVPPSKVLTSTSVMYLSIAPNALPVASALTLSLTCTSVDSGLTSSASVVVVTNSPPSPGLCQLSTYSGTELSTTFLLSTSGWIDSDIPIYYQFGFISPSSSSRLLIQTKSQLTFAQSTLPAGLASKNYSLTTTFQIYDNLGSSTSEYVSVQVMSSNRNLSAINQLTSIMLTEASGNVDSLKQTVSIISSIVNAVNCTGRTAPLCTDMIALRRRIPVVRVCQQIMSVSMATATRLVYQRRMRFCFTVAAAV